MKDRLIALICEHDEDHISERGFMIYNITLADEIINMLKDIQSVCDCECCKAVDRLRDS
jgi:hypothetical protein